MVPHTTIAVEAGFEASKLLKDFVSSTTEVTHEEKETVKCTETQQFSIGPGDRLYFYRQTFSPVRTSDPISL